MKKLTKVLLIIITIFFISISITSCGKKEKIRYEYNLIELEYNQDSEYIITDTNVTANKCNDHLLSNTFGCVLYSTYSLKTSFFCNFIIDATNNVDVGWVEEIENKETGKEVKLDDINILSATSNSDEINRYEYSTKNDFYLVIFSQKETQYSINVDIKYYSADKEFDIDDLKEANKDEFACAYQIEGNNNVYCIDNEFDGRAYADRFQITPTVITLFTNDFETTPITVYMSKAKITTDKFKLKIRKATEYNILDIIDDDGRVYIPGDTNEWVVVKVPDELDCSFIHSWVKGEKQKEVLTKRMVIKEYYPETSLVVMSWEEQCSDIISREICIRKGMTYRFVKCPKLYFEVNGKTYDDLDTIELHQGDMIGVYDIKDGIKKYYAFKLLCNSEERQNRQDIVDFMSLSEDGPVEVTKTNEEIKKIKYIQFDKESTQLFKYLIDNYWDSATIVNTYKVTNGEA